MLYTDDLIKAGDVSIFTRRNQLGPESKTTLVFLHDSLGCTSLWRDFPAQLGEGLSCNVFMYDRQGYGQSDPFSGEARGLGYLEDEARILEQVLDAARIDQCMLFGHSDGGSIALIAAALFPERILAVITEGAHVFVEDVTLQGIRAAMHQFETTDLAQKLSRYHGDKTSALFDAWTKTWTAPFFRDWNIEHFLSVITCPVLAVQGSDDEFGTPAQLDAIASGAGAETLLMPGFGHNPHKEDPAAMVRVVQDFLG